MLTLYTAVGTLKFQKTTGGKSIPLVINDGQEYGLSDDELLLWSCLAFQILTLHELQDAYTLRQIQKEGPKGLSFQHYLNRLSLRGLVVSGIGLTGVDALYRLLGSLTIIPLPFTATPPVCPSPRTSPWVPPPTPTAPPRLSLSASCRMSARPTPA